MSVPCILRFTRVKNSGKSIVPEPSVSASLIVSYNSVGFWPMERMMVPSSLVVMVKPT